MMMSTERRPGDRDCPDCGELIFAGRESCRQCTPPPQKRPRPLSPPSDYAEEDNNTDLPHPPPPQARVKRQFRRPPLPIGRPRVKFAHRMGRDYRVFLSGPIPFDHEGGPRVETDTSGLEGQEFQLLTESRRQEVKRDGTVTIAYDIDGVTNSAGGGRAYITVFHGPSGLAHLF